MKDTMRFIFKQTEAGWVCVRECKSFRHACKVALELTFKTGIQHCANSK